MNNVSETPLQTVAAQLTTHGFAATVVKNKAEALNAVKALIPAGSNVMNGSSTTLIEIGFIDYFKGTAHGWTNLHAPIVAEKDRAKGTQLRRKALTAQYFLASANAVSETGEMVFSDASGSRVGALPFAAEHVILVVGKNKIVPTLQDALDRVWKVVFPLENQRAQKAYGMPSSINKTFIWHKEAMPDRVQVILVDENLGF